MKYTMEELEAAMKKVIEDGEVTAKQQGELDSALDASDFFVKSVMTLYWEFMRRPSPSGVAALLSMGIAFGIEVERAHAETGQEPETQAA